MDRNIVVEEACGVPIDETSVEMVERKGLGHPDSLADGIAEAISRNLCKEYLERFGSIFHHNTDQAEVIAGQAKACFGGGEVLSPITFFACGRAVTEIENEKVPVDVIAREAAKNYLSGVLRNIDVEADCDIDIRLGKGSADLTELFGRKMGVPLANDTSFGVGFAPFSETESIVLEAEKLLNSADYKKKNPAVGEDIKVMGMRRDGEIGVTIACAVVDKYVCSLEEYDEVKEILKRDVEKLASKITSKKVGVGVNTADNYEKASVFLTVTGTSAENGDDGSVGRGNRATGLITPYRPMSLEATAGKNPVNHVGKLYNILANQIAEKVVKEQDGVKCCYVRILSKIGHPIDQPQLASVQLALKPGSSIKKLQPEAEAVADDALANITRLTEKIVAGKARVF